MIYGSQRLTYAEFAAAVVRVADQGCLSKSRTPLRHQRRCQHCAACDCLVFATRTGTQLDRHHVLRSFRTVAASAGLTARD